MEEEMSQREFRMYVIIMINEAHDEMKEQMQALNDRTTQQLKEQMWEAKDHFNKEVEILENKQTNKQKSLK